jgi:hypothetical protein
MHQLIQVVVVEDLVEMVDLRAPEVEMAVQV